MVKRFSRLDVIVSMAACESKLAKQKLLEEKVSSIPPFDPENCSEFQAVSAGITIDVKASSEYEAAMKMGFVLLAMDILKRGAQPKPLTVKKSEQNFIYNAVENFVNDKRTVELELVTIENARVPELEALWDGASSTSTSSQAVAAIVDLADGELIENTLRHFFGFENFRPLQKETIAITMSGADVLTILGTGGGKTLMYMLPAVLASKPTLVISPIKSLIADIAERATRLNISVCQFTGDVPPNIQEEQLRQLNNFRIILTTPEMLETGPFRDTIDSLTSNGQMERFVFEEAHTISTWGSSFRPTYRSVCEALAKAQCPKLLISATVPEKVEQNLKEIFGDFTTLRTSVFRDNLFLEVVERPTKFMDELVDYILKQEGRCGIVYCVLPKDVAHIHSELQKRQVSAAKYHGQLSDVAKTSNYSKWLNGDVSVIVANSSFGMGIDKANVRYIIHAKLPTSVDEYFQQCGRAGRDGEPATCRVYYSYGDKNMLYKLLTADQHTNCEEQCSSVGDLICLLEDPVRCRHKTVLSYFGEQCDSFECLNKCDNCHIKGNHQLTDGTTDAVKIVQAVVELTGQDISCNTLKLFLAGSRQKQCAELEYLETFGCLKKKFVPVSLLNAFLHLLIKYEILKEKLQKKQSTLTIHVGLGPKAHSLLGGNISVLKYEKCK